MSEERLYRISPLHKKSVEYFVDVYEELPDGTIRGFDVTETWRWGYGFREMEDRPWKFEAAQGITCQPDVGWGADLDDLCAVHVNFTDGFTDEERAEIEARLRGELEDDEGRWGTPWIYDGEHNWQVEDEHIRILAPVKVDIVDANGYGDGAVIEENVELHDE